MTTYLGVDPELPAKLWLELDPYPPITLDGWYLSERPGTVRYDLHIPGSAVIPPELVARLNALADTDGWWELVMLLRAARDGAS